MEIEIESGTSTYMTNRIFFVDSIGLASRSTVSGTILKTVTLQNYNTNDADIIAQSGVTITANNHGLPAQTVEIDISDIQQDCYLTYHCC